MSDRTCRAWTTFSLIFCGYIGDDESSRRKPVPKFGYLHDEPSSDAEGVDTGQISLVVIRGLDVICGPLPISEMPSYRLKYPAIFSRLIGLREDNADIDHLVRFHVVTDNEMPDGYILMEGDDGTFIVVDPDGNILGVFDNIKLASDAAWDDFGRRTGYGI